MNVNSTLKSDEYLKSELSQYIQKLHGLDKKQTKSWLSCHAESEVETFSTIDDAIDGILNWIKENYAIGLKILNDNYHNKHVKILFEGNREYVVDYSSRKEKVMIRIQIKSPVDEIFDKVFTVCSIKKGLNSFYLAYSKENEWDLFLEELELENKSTYDSRDRSRLNFLRNRLLRKSPYSL